MTDDSPGYGVNDSFNNSDTTDPPMEKVVSAEINFEQVNERVVAAGKYDERQHIDS